MILSILRYLMITYRALSYWLQRVSAILAYFLLHTHHVSLYVRIVRRYSLSIKSVFERILMVGSWCVQREVHLLVLLLVLVLCVCDRVSYMVSTLGT